MAHTHVPSLAGPAGAPADAIGAFCTHANVRLAGAKVGPLAGTTFAAKDVFAIEGVTACFGNPTWLATHVPAVRTAAAVTALLASGASLAGLTMTDELALSLTGENAHYGTPINICAPDRVPGGSSSGSAAAVAAGVVDFALGTDTGGSVRVPASHCGLFGFRPTHDAVSTVGVLPLARRFDTVGWFARDGATLARVGDVLLPGDGSRAAEARATALPRRLILADDATALLERAAQPVFPHAAAALARRLDIPLAPLAPLALGGDIPPAGWLTTYLALQAADADAAHRAWIARWQPRFGSLIAGRFARLLAVSPQDVAAAETMRAAFQQHVATVMGDDAWFLWPSAGGAAPPRGLPDAAIDAVTGQSLTLGALASLLGLPQLTLPLAAVDGCPFGVSLVGPRGSDRALLAAAASLSQSPAALPPAAAHAPTQEPSS